MLPFFNIPQNVGGKRLGGSRGIWKPWSTWLENCFLFSSLWIFLIIPRRKILTLLDVSVFSTNRTLVNSIVSKERGDLCLQVLTVSDQTLINCCVSLSLFFIVTFYLWHVTLVFHLCWWYKVSLKKHISFSKKGKKENASRFKPKQTNKQKKTLMSTKCFQCARYCSTLLLAKVDTIIIPILHEDTEPQTG